MLRNLCQDDTAIHASTYSPTCLGNPTTPNQFRDVVRARLEVPRLQAPFERDELRAKRRRTWTRCHFLDGRDGPKGVRDHTVPNRRGKSSPSCFRFVFELAPSNREPSRRWGVLGDSWCCRAASHRKENPNLEEHGEKLLRVVSRTPNAHDKLRARPARTLPKQGA